MLIRLAYIFVLLTALFISNTSAQNSDLPEFEHLTTETGLSQSIITSIAQDKMGFIWIGTEDGLNKYDGFQTEVFRRDFSDPSTISDNWIRDMLLDSDGTLWFATHNGLSRYNPELSNFTQFHHNPENGNSLSSNYLISLCEYNNEIWIGTGNEGITRYNKRTNTFKRYTSNLEKPNSLPSNEIKSFLVDQYNVLWIGTNNGLVKYNEEDDNFNIYKTESEGNQLLSSNEIRSIHEDTEGRLWVGTGSNGLYWLSSDRQNAYNFQNDPSAPYMLNTTGINAIKEDDIGTLWIASTQGIVRKQANSTTYEVLKNSVSDPNSLTNNDISCLFQDRSKMLWIGTQGGGVNIFDVHKKQFKHYKHDYKNPNSLSKDVVRAIFEDSKQRLWIGLREGGVDIFDRTSNTFTNFPNSSSPDGLWANTASAIYEDKFGLVWIGSWGQGVNVMIDEGKFKHFTSSEDPSSINDNRIQSIFEDQDGDLWIATDGGLNFFDRAKERFIRYSHDPDNPNSLGNNAVQSQAIHIDQEGFIWIGTYGGGFNKYDKTSGIFTRYQPSTENSLPDKGYISLYGSKEYIWIGTDGGGLIRFNKYTEEIKIYTTENGLCSDVIYAIKPDNNDHLWLSTKNGLSKFSPKEEKFKNYYSYHGIQSNVFYWGAAHKSKYSEELFFGGINGITIFKPSQIEDNSFIPPVFITNLKINNVAVSVGSETNPTPLTKNIAFTDVIELDHTVKYFSFDFVSLNYSHSERNRYKYKMEGFNNDWVETTAENPHAPYTNLPAGDYTFKVLGSNNDGLWNPTPATIRVIMIPPWYERDITKVLGGLLFVIIVFGSYQIRVKFLEKQRRELIHQVKLRTAEVTEKNEELEIQQKEILKQNDKIHSSIQYAKRIQRSMLPTDEELDSALKDWFLVFRPRDIVSGDFYWISKQENKTVVAAVDCTGHGVPGAFMSMIGADILKETVVMKGITEPSEILTEMDKGVRNALHQDQYRIRDGMDISLCTLEKTDLYTTKVTYSGAHNPLVYIQEDGQPHTIKGSRAGIGGYEKSNQQKNFEQHELIFNTPTMLYLYSDGYQDQFGGKKGRKLMAKNFKRLLSELHQMPVKEQEAHLHRYFEKWKGETPQTDDILIFGMRINSELSFKGQITS